MYPNTDEIILQWREKAGGERVIKHSSLRESGEALSLGMTKSFKESGNPRDLRLAHPGVLQDIEFLDKHRIPDGLCSRRPAATVE